MEDNDYAGPSRNISGRERRARVKFNRPSDDDVSGIIGGNDEFRRNLKASALKRKEYNSKNADIDETTRRDIAKFLESISDGKRKITNVNCFETTGPLDMFSVDDVRKPELRVQDWPLFLDTTRQIYGCRVDRLHNETQVLSQSLTKGDISNNDEQLAANNVDSEEMAKRKKKKNLDDGMAAFEEVIHNLEEMEQGTDGYEVDEEALEENEDETPFEESEINDWDENCDIDEYIEDIINQRLKIAQDDIFKEASSQCVIDEKLIELQNTDINWLKSNSYYQKAIMGSADDVAATNSSILYNGLYSKDGRVFKLHPRIIDSKGDEPINPNVNIDVVSTMREIIYNAMSSKPYEIENSLMLEVLNRPKCASDSLDSVLNRRNAARNAKDREGANGEKLGEISVMIPNQFSSGPSTTILQDQTLFENAALSPELESLMSTNNDGPILPVRSASRAVVVNSTEDGIKNGTGYSEFGYVPLDDIIIDDDISYALPRQPSYPTEGLEAILNVKATLVDEHDDETKKVWKRGIMAEEWDDQNSDMAREMSGVQRNGLDTYFKALDLMVNGKIVKMIFNIETISRLRDESQQDELGFGPTLTHKYLPDIPGKYYLLVSCNDYKKLFPQDRKDHFLRIDDDDGDIPITVPSGADDGDLDEVGGMEDDDFGMMDVGTSHLQFNEGLAGGLVDDVERSLNVVDNGEDDHVADVFFGGVDNEPPAVNNMNQDDIEKAALAPEEIPELFTNLIIEERGVRPDIEAEIRNLGKEDNSHWKGPNTREEVIDAKQMRKKREKKTKKKIGVEDYMRYFEPSTEIDQVEKITAVRCQEARNPASLQLKESQIYMDEMPTEFKPHIAFEFESLSKSGLLFNKKYGKLKFERVPIKRSKNDDILIEDIKGGGNVDSDCLNWLLSFSGFKCAYQSDHDKSQIDSLENNNNNSGYGMDGIDGDDFDYDDRDVERDPTMMHENAMAKMNESTQAKFLNTCNGIYNVRRFMRNRDGEEMWGSDDEQDAMNYGKNFRANNLDAPKHKRSMAELLSSDVLTMPNLQYALELFEEEQKSRKQAKNDETLGNDEACSSANTSMQRNKESAARAALSSVFKLETNEKPNVDVSAIWNALTEVKDYQEEMGENSKTDEMQIDPANPPLQKIKVNGVHTFMSMMLSLPYRMRENVHPSALLSFALHLCNENNLQLIQDRTKKDWMNDFLIINKGDPLPEGIQLGNMDEVEDEFWRESLDPHARLAEMTEESDIPNSTEKAKKRKNGGCSEKNLSQIAEEDEEEGADTV